MQSIRKIDTCGHAMEGFGNSLPISDVNLRQPYESSEGFLYAGLIEAEHPSQHPFGLKKNRVRDEDPIALHDRSCAEFLVGIVASQKANNDVSIDREHAAGALLP